jgi:hypothetical protein
MNCTRSCKFIHNLWSQENYRIDVRDFVSVEGYQGLLNIEKEGESSFLYPVSVNALESTTTKE